MSDGPIMITDKESRELRNRITVSVIPVLVSMMKENYIEDIISNNSEITEIDKVLARKARMLAEEVVHQMQEDKNVHI